MVGIDLTRISRFENKDSEFVKRMLSKTELEKYNNLDFSQKSLYLARIWSVKEAIFKADNSFFEFNKINLEEDGKLTFSDFEISISHEDDYLVAVAIKIRKEYNACNC